MPVSIETPGAPARATPPARVKPPVRATPLARVFRGAILAYRYALSPLLGPNCRYWPTCSAYALDAVDQHGAVRGAWLAARRILRCHPWREGGYDPVPPAARRRPASTALTARADHGCRDPHCQSRLHG